MAFSLPGACSLSLSLSLSKPVNSYLVICSLCAQVKSESFAMGSYSSPPESSGL